MIGEYIEFVQSLFPCINPYTKENIRAALKQFEVTGKTFNCLQSTPTTELVQGDIVGNIPFYRIKPDGRMATMKTKGMIISNSCDIENDDEILIAPLIPLELIATQTDRVNIEKNKTTRWLYFPDPLVCEYVVDLSLINSFPKDGVIKLLNDKKIDKIASLNQYGYYMFICKLTIHLLRPEDPTVDRVA